MYSLTFHVRAMLPQQHNSCTDRKFAQYSTSRGTLYHPPTYIRVRAVVSACGRGQTHRQTCVTTIHFASSVSVRICWRCLRRTDRVGDVPSDAADVASFRRRTLVRPQTVEVWPDVTHSKLGAGLLTCFLVVSSCRR